MLKEICVIVVVCFVGTLISKVFVLTNNNTTKNGVKMTNWHIVKVDHRPAGTIWVTIENDEKVSHEDFLSQYELDKVNELVGEAKTFRSECDDPEDAFADMIRQALG